jgi:hypothetical protein
MYKIKINDLVYYFNDVATYTRAAKVAQKYSNQEYYLLLNANIVVDVKENKFIKNRQFANIEDLVDSQVEIDTPNEITITVSGTAHTGKTRIAALINKFLMLEGFQSSMVFKEENPRDVYDSLDDAISEIKKNTIVNIKEQHLCRSGV